VTFRPDQIRPLIDRFFSGLGRPVRTNLGRLVEALSR
jgi:hypothetical protein